MMLTLGASSFAQSTLTVADGTTTNSYVPIYGLWADAYLRCQTIYPASTIDAAVTTMGMNGGTITGLTYYLSSPATAAWTGTWEVKLKEVPVTTTTLSAFLDMTDATTVYTGLLDGTSSTLTIEFTTPYTYQGGNLLVEVSQTTKGNYKSAYFYGESVSNASWQGYNSSSWSSITGSVKDFIPKTTFTFTGGTPISCRPVQNLVVDAAQSTSSSLTLTWTDALNTGASYSVYDLSNNTVVQTGIAGNTYTVTGLSDNTSYTFGVEANCSATDASIMMSATGRTKCAAINLPWTCGFETDEIESTTAATALPWCTQRYVSPEATSGLTYPYSYSGYAHGGSRSLYFYGTTSTSYPALMALILPAVDVAAYPMNGNRVIFWGRSSSTSYNKTVYVGTLTNPSDISTLSIIDSVVVTGTTHTKYTISLANAPATAPYIAIAVKRGSGSLYLDDMTIEVLPACLEITSASVTDKTAHSITVTWVPNDGNTNATYTVYNMADTSVVATNLTGTAYTVNNLSANTQYTFGIQANCPAGDAQIITTTGRTACEAETIPFTEDFSATLASDQCWTGATGITAAEVFAGASLNLGTISAGYWNFSSSQNGFTDGHYYNNIYGSSRKSWMITPPIDLSTATTAQLSFDMALTAYSGTLTAPATYTGGQKFMVIVSTDGGNTWRENNATVWMNADSNATYAFEDIPYDHYGTYVINLNQYVGNTIKIAFYGESTVSGGDNNFHIDNIAVTEVPNCPNVLGLTLNDQTATTANISWNGNGASNYEVEVLQNDVPVTTVSIVVTDTAAVISNLVIDNDYQIAVRAVCGSDFGQWSNPLNVHTGHCVPTILSFDPDGITSVSFGGMTNTTHPSSAAYANYANLSGTVPAGLTASVDIVYATGYSYGTIIWVDWNNNFSFEGNEVVYVGVSTNSIPDTLTATFRIPVSTTPGNYRMRIMGADMAFDSYTSSIAAAANANPCSSYTYAVAEDYTLTVDPAPSCLPVADLVASDVRGKTATLTWTAVGTESAWDIYLRTSSENEPGATTTPTTSASTTSYTFNGLDGLTTYTAYVRANCGSGDVSEWDSVAFTTLCEPKSLPYTENFDSYSSTGASSYPTCWYRHSTYSTSSNSNNYPYISSTYSHSSSRSLYFTCSISTYNLAVLQEVDLGTLSMSDLRVKFFMRSSNVNAWMVVGVVSDPSDPTTFVPVDTVQNSTASVYEEHKVFLSNYSGTGYFVAFKILNTVGPYTIYLDDITVEETPSCLEVEDLAITALTTTTATVEWTAVGNTSAWDLYISSSSTDVPDATTTPMYTTTATSYTFSGLTPNTAYTAFVRTNCGDGDVSEWLSVRFTTPCAIETAPYVEDFAGFNTTFSPCWKRYSGLADPTTTATSSLAGIGTAWLFNSVNAFGNEHAKLNIYGASVNYWLVTPAINLSNLNNPELTFDLALTDYGNANPIENATAQSDDKFIVFVSTDNGDTWNMSNATVWDNAGGDYVYNNISTTGEKVSIPLSQYMGQTIKIAFYGESTVSGNGDNDLHIDNISVDETPACSVPTYVTASNVSSANTTVSWTAGGSESAWDLYISSSSTDVPDATTTPMYSTSATSYTFSGLTGNTAYTAYVRANCGGDVVSDWVSVNFSTSCTPVRLPYFENFDSFTSTGSDVYPECWFRHNSSSQKYPYVTSGTPYSGTRCLYFVGSTSIYSLAVLPEFDLVDNTMSDLQVSFMMRPYNTNTKLIVGVMTNPLDPATFEPIDTVANATALAYEQHKVYLTNYSGTGRYVALKSLISGGTYNIYLDDIKVDIPTCMEVNNLTLTDATVSNVTVSWAAGGNESAWDLYISSSSTDVPDATTTPMYSTSATSYTFPSLTANTSYTAYVRANCGGGDVSDWVSVPAKTLCDEVTLPYTENFDSYTPGVGNYPECWAIHSNYNTGYPYINGNNAVSGNNSLYFFTSSSTYNIAVLPKANLGTLSMSDLRVIFTMNPSDVKAYMEVGVMTDPEDPTTFEPVDTVQNALPSTFEQHKVLLTQYTGNGRYVALKNLNIDGYYSIYLDDVVLEQAPSCMEPENLTVMEVSSETVTLSWTTNDISTGYTVEYSSDNGNTWTTASSTVTASPYTITNLTPRTQYDARVFANCGSETSNASYTSVTTQCVLQGELSIGTVEIATSSYLPFSSPWNYSISEQLFTAAELGNQPNNLSAVSFYCTSNYVTDRDWDIYMISVPSTVTALDSFVALNSGSMMDTVFSGAVRINNGWVTVNFDKDYPYDGTSNLILVLDDNTGTYNNTFYFAIDSYTNGSIFARSDNTNYDPINMPNQATNKLNSRNVVKFTYCNDMGVICPVPTDLAASNVTATTADITWTAPNTAYQALQLQYKLANVQGDGWMNAENPVSPKVLTNLTPETEYMVRMRTICDVSDTSVWSDTLRFTTADLCQTPTALAVVPTSNSAEVTWTPADDETSWNVQYRTLSADTSWREVAGGVTTPSVTLTGLASNTEYSVRVQANCGNDGVSNWVSTDFTTPCGVMLPPYTENFDNTNGTLPDCWTNINEVGSTNWVVASSFHGNVSAAHSGSNVMQFYQGRNGHAASLQMPTFDLTGISNPILKFWFTNQKWGGDQDVMEVYYRTSPTDTWTLLATYDNNVSEWAKDSLLLPNPSATYQIKFKANSNYGYGINIDDVSIEEGPNCFVPQNLIASNVTDDGATISWTPGNTETAWDIYLSSDASIVPDATTTPLATATTTSYTFTSLTALTQYLAYVRANCGNGDVSEWISVDFIPGTYNMKVSGWDTLHTCGIVIYDDGGANYDYSDNCNSYLVIYPDAPNHYVQVSGTIVAEGNIWDYLTIYDGADNSTQLYKSNQNTNQILSIPTITSTTGPLTIYFHSDGSNSYDGLELTVGCICKVTNEFSATACESYTWNNEVYTTSGDYEQTLPTATGCDSVVTLHLTIHNPTHVAYTESACGSYTWNNTEYTQSGTYTYSHQDANGCTQVDTLHLMINPIPVVTITGDAAIALFESATLAASGAATYVWSTGETTPSIKVTPPSIGSHTYTVTGTSEYNCVSVPVSFTVEVGACRPGVSTETVTACDSYTWHGVTYTQSTNNATYRIPDGAASGCDSVITLHLTILNKVLNEFSASNCVSYEWNGQVYTASGDYTQTFPAANGCDSVVTLHLTIKQPVTKTVNIVDCDSYTWIDQTYTTSGDYTRTFTAANGCDSIVTLHLTIKNHVTQEITASDCGSYTWNNEVYEASGDYEQIFTAANGCDSVVTLHLTINPEYDLALEQSICKAALPYSWRDTVFAIGTETGMYVFHRQTVAGCDSTVTLHLVVNDAIATEVTETGCDSYTWNNQVYTTSGDYVQTLQTAAGCDSTVTMHLTIFNLVHEAITVVNCGPYQWNNAEYAQSGTYTYSHEDAHGCTQVDTLYLTVKPVPVVTITPASGMPIIAYGESETLTASGADSYVWNTQETTPSINVAPRITTTYSVVGTTDGCESESVSITVNVGNCTLITSEFTATGCGRYTWNGIVYEQSGDYQQLLVNDLGCDSLVTLHLTIYPNSGVAQSVNACGSYLWYHQNLTESGTYTFAYYDGNGCIQEDTLYLTINHPVNESLNIVSCGPYMWNNTEYTQDGTYTYTHEDAHGCTQVDTLRLTIKPVPVVTVSSNNTQIVQHESTTLTASGATSYVWSNQATGATVTVTPMQTTTYSVVGTVDGCASEPATITVEVTPCTPAEGVFTVTACDRYVWYGTTYAESTNTATHAIQRPGMCDSIVTLHLTILHPVAEIINITACERYTWHNTTFTQSGRYTYSHQDANGCTQVDTLYLTILRPTHTAVTVSECNAFVWHNIEYTQSGTYTFAFADVNGCTQVDTLHLTIFHPAHTAYNVDACGSYVWNNTEYTQSGTYTYRHRDANGCQQIDTLHLTIHHPVAQSYEAVACESYTWNNTVYTQSGTYTYAHEDAHGCMQVDTLRLTIHNAVAESFEAEACESYTWNNTVYTQSGIYTYAHADANGCTQVDTLHLTIYNAVAEVYEAEACESYTWNNTEYTQSGTYTYTHEDIHGCTQVDTLHLIINNPTHTAVTESACGSYTWNNTEYTQSGIYTYAHADANGCTQVDTLHLTIFQPATTEFSDNACGSYYWNNVYYNESGDYVQHFQTVEGCDSTVTLHLTIYPRAEVAGIVGDTLIHEYESATLTATALNGNPFWVGFGQTSSITVAPMTTTTYTVMAVSEHCASAPVRVTVTVLPCIPVQGVETVTACESYEWHGVTYTESTNTPTFTIERQGVCDSVVTLHLTIFNPTHVAYTESACGSYVWNNTEYTQSGTYTYTYTDANGCTQVDTLHLTINNPVAATYEAEACGSYTWNNTEYTQSGTYTFALLDANGCTQVDTLHLTIHNAVAEVFETEACGSYTWNNTEYTQSGTYTFAHLDANGCTQVDTLHLIINNPTHTAVTESACGSYTWNNTEYTQSGTYTFAHTDVHGCTQVDTLHLTILNAVHEAFTVSECNAYTWHGTTYTQSGTYTFIHSDANGCTKVDTLHLTVFHPQPDVMTITSCGDFAWYGTVYTQSGVYTHPSVSPDGCDQVDTLYLTVNRPQNTSSTAEACGSYVWRGNTYTQSGVYLKAVQDNFGCMYLDTLYLTIHQPLMQIVEATACESYTWNNVTYTQSGHYVQHFQTTFGCDSTVTLNLTVNHPQHQSVTAGECGSYTWHGATYTASGVYTYVHSDANGCTQVDTLHLIIYQPIHQSLRITECESFTWGGTTYTQSGVYTYAHPDNHGCTQVDTLYLTINHPTGTSLTVSECGMYDWNGFIYTQSGTYTQSHLDANGCTQVDTLRLTIYHPVHQSVTVTECFEYTWHGTTYTQSGTYTYVHTDNHGCTQVDTLHLTIHHPQSSTITVDACGSYQWYGTNYTQSGVYTHNVTGTYGCQVKDTLILHIHQPVSTQFSARACSYYVWDGTVYTQSGDYVKHYYTQWGCDSTVTLHLDIHQPQSSEFTIVTENSCYTWNGVEYCQNGTYMQQFEDSFGCDSVVTLHLTLRVGVEDYDGYAVSLYPNPTTGVAYVEVSGDEMERVEVYDSYGKLLQTRNVSGNVAQIELSAYAKGVYHVRVTTTKGVVTKRVVKN